MAGTDLRQGTGLQLGKVVTIDADGNMGTGEGQQAPIKFAEGKHEGNTLSIVDNGISRIVLPDGTFSSAGALLVSVAYGATNYSALISYKASSSSSYVSIIAESEPNSSFFDLQLAEPGSGTTADGKMGILVYDGHLAFQNRLGSTRVITATFFGHGFFG